MTRTTLEPTEDTYSSAKKIGLMHKALRSMPSPTLFYGNLASPHAGFSLFLSFSGPYRRSSEDDKRSFVKFAITLGGEIYGACGSSLYLMTGMRDVTMCANIVYGKHFRTHLPQISFVSAKNDFSGACTWTRVSREWYILP